MRYNNSPKKKRYKKLYKNKKYKQKILEIRRVIKIVKGGPIVGFRATVVTGNKATKIGLGTGYAATVKLAIAKGCLNAKKHIINVPVTSNCSIPYFVKSSYGASSLMLKPSFIGCGIVGGPATHTIFELTGVKNIITKQFGAKSFINNAKATFIALSYLNNLSRLRKKIL